MKNKNFKMPLLVAMLGIASLVPMLNSYESQNDSGFKSQGTYELIDNENLKTNSFTKKVQEDVGVDFSNIRFSYSTDSNYLLLITAFDLSESLKAQTDVVIGYYVNDTEYLLSYNDNPSGKTCFSGLSINVDGQEEPVVYNSEQLFGSEYANYKMNIYELSKTAGDFTDFELLSLKAFARSGENTYYSQVENVRKQDITISSINEQYYQVVEAENLDSSTFKSPVSSYVENFDLSSTLGGEGIKGTCINGNAIGSKGVVNVYIKMNIDARVDIVGMMACGTSDGVKLLDKFTITIDDENLYPKTLLYGDTTVSSSIGHNFRAVSIGRPLLTKGLHVLKLTAKNNWSTGIAIDSFRFYAFDEANDGYDITVNENGTYKLEAENLSKNGLFLLNYWNSVSKFEFVENQAGKTDSNGKHVKNTYKNGSSIVIRLNLEKDATVNFSAAVSAYGSSETGVSKVDVCIDDNKYETQEIAYTGKSWSVASLKEYTLTAGEHIFIYRVQNTGTWLDYFKLDVTNII